MNSLATRRWSGHTLCLYFFLRFSSCECKEVISDSGVHQILLCYLFLRATIAYLLALDHLSKMDEHTHKHRPPKSWTIHEHPSVSATFLSVYTFPNRFRCEHPRFFCKCIQFLFCPVSTGVQDRRIPTYCIQPIVLLSSFHPQFYHGTYHHHPKQRKWKHHLRLQ